jgi:hypothetical protein
MLTKKTDDPDTWYPTSIAKLDGLLSKAIRGGTGFQRVYALRKNIAYNLQYLEFLDRCVLGSGLTSVLRTQTYKMFIIVGCGIMESLLTYLLMKSGDYAKTSWELECVMPGQAKAIGRERKRIDCLVYRKLGTPKPEEMTFDSLIKKAEAKKLLWSDHKVYARLQYLRKLRNKVHLHVIDNPTDTDWNAFHERHVNAMAQVIHASFTSNIFRPSQEERGYFTYLERYNTQQLDSPEDFQ